jgi:hypothetical protein
MNANDALVVDRERLRRARGNGEVWIPSIAPPAPS